MVVVFVFSFPLILLFCVCECIGLVGELKIVWVKTLNTFTDSEFPSE